MEQLELSKADFGRMAYVGSLARERDSDAWYTPLEYVTSARRVFGGKIDLDPYGSAVANVGIQAGRFFCTDDPAPDGKKWPKVDSVFMNPPYSMRLVRQATDQFCEAFRRRRFQRGIVLVNNATETLFFQKLLHAATAMCLPNHRIRFHGNVDGKDGSKGNTRGQAFLYFAADGKHDDFAAEFDCYGPIVAII
jgi:hypothetical protein